MNLLARRLTGLVVAAVGVAFILVVMLDGLFSVGPAFDRMSNGFRPIMKAAPIAALQSDLTGLKAVGTEFTTSAVPKLAGALQMTPAQFSAMMGQQFPAVARGMSQLPATVTTFQGVVGTLQAEQGRFAQADAIPMASLPATTVPWGLLAAGIVALLVGLGILFVRGRVWPIVAVVLGALLIAAPLSLSLLSKASAADTMNANLKPVYTAATVDGAAKALSTVGAMGAQMQQMLPSLGQQLGMDSGQLQAYLQQNLPATAAALQGMPASMARFQNLLTVFRAHLADYNAIKDVAFVPIVWAMIVGGIVVLVGGAGALVVTRRREEVAAEPIPMQRAA